MSVSTADPLEVETDGGTLAGVRVNGVRTWRGVPYGTAERWKLPVRVQWKGVWPAEDYGPVAPQTTYTWKDEVVGNEDCLNLDVVRPDTDEQLPVVVYLHGGGFFAGASHTAVLRGFNFSKELNVVYVAVNFRLGVLGYLDMSALGAGDSDTCEPNPAVHDHLAALRWVQRNIAEFGGDPDNVTVMGESAGGSAAAVLMAVPEAEGLFHRAIVQSAPVMTVHSPEQSIVWARKLAQYAGLFPRTCSIADLRALPVSDLVRAGQQMLWRGGGLRELNPCFGTAVDGKTLPEGPLHQFQHGHQHKVPLLIGTNNDELSAAQMLYLTKSTRARAARTMLNAHDPVLASEIERAYGDLGERGSFALMLTDAIFWAQSVRLAELHSTTGAGVWMYRFDYAPALLRKLGVGAMHSMELSALFGDSQSSKARILLGKEQNIVTTHMQSAWRDFVWGQDPGWQHYHAPSRATRIFELEPHTVNDPRREFRLLWKDFAMRGWVGEESSIAMPRPGR